VQVVIFSLTFNDLLPLLLGHVRAVFITPGMAGIN
jgi:hypothetical protein